MGFQRRLGPSPLPFLDLIQPRGALYRKFERTCGHHVGQEVVDRVGLGDRDRLRSWSGDDDKCVDGRLLFRKDLEVGCVVVLVGGDGRQRQERRQLCDR